MERVPHEDFAEAHRERLRAMLDIGDELGLFYRPDIFLHQTGNYEVEATVEGRPMNTIATNTDIGVVAHKFMEVAKVQLAAFRARLHVEHLGAAYAAAGADDMSGPLSSEAKSDIKSAVDSTIGGYDFTLSRMMFTDDLYGSRFDVTMLRSEDSSGNLAAREIVLALPDEGVDRTLTVNELIMEGESTVGIEQAFKLIWDADIHGMSKFFLREHRDIASFRLMYDLFADVLAGRPTEGLTWMMDRYSSPEDKRRVEGFVAMVRGRAENAASSWDPNAGERDVSVPSEAELGGYAALLRSLRT